MQQLSYAHDDKCNEKRSFTSHHQQASGFNAIVCFVFIFTLIFAPKIGPIDFSLVIPFLLLLTCLRLDLKIGSVELKFFLLFSAVLIYQFSISFYNGVPDIQPIARLVRGLLQALFLYLFMASSPLVRIKNGIDIFYYCAIAHSIIVVLGAVIPELNLILSLISGNEKSPSFRSSGLLAGFDISGMISAIALLYFQLFKSNGSVSFKDVLFLTFIFLSCVFTSRVSIFLGGLILCFILVNFLKSKRLPLSFKLISGLFFTVYIFSFIICSIIIIEFSFEVGIIEIPTSFYSQLAYVFAANSYETLLNMFFLPDTFLNTLFGLGQEVGKTDVGYVINVYRFGVVGMFLAGITYIYAVFSIRRGNMRRFLYLFLAIMLLLNFKNDYFFVRGILPVFLFFYFYSIVSRNVR